MLHLAEAHDGFVKSTLDDLANVSFLEDREHHPEDCDACVLIKNIELRVTHDLSMWRIHHAVASELRAVVSKTTQPNVAAQGNFLSMAISTRSLIEAILRSCILYFKLDIRIFNKYIADSLASFNKFKWGSLHYVLDTRELSGVLEEYASMGRKGQNDSVMYYDPAPTFKSKIELLDKVSPDPAFHAYFDELLEFYSFLSDIVHGGSAFIAACNFNQRSTVIEGQKITLENPGEILIKQGSYQFCSSAYQLLEFIGVSQVFSLRLLKQLYLPILIVALSNTEECAGVHAAIKRVHTRLIEATPVISF
ncbi:MAG TPA: hypothetical protein VIO59_14665 [Rhodanobacter sp.]